MKLSFSILLFVLFGVTKLQAQGEYGNYQGDSLLVDSTDGYEVSDNKLKFTDRWSSEVLNGVALTFLTGSDAKSVKSSLRDDIGKAEVFPRIGYYFRYFGKLQIYKGLYTQIGIGYDMKGWFERHEIEATRTLSTSIRSNDIYIRTDYVSFNVGVGYQVKNIVAVRAGVDLSVLTYSYYRVGQYIRPDYLDFGIIPRSITNPVLPSFDFGLSFGKSVKLDLDYQYSGKVFKNVDYRYMMFKVGINYTFNMIVPQQNVY